MPSPNTARRITDREFSADDRLLFDTNVWMRLLGVQGSPGDTSVAVYSAAYKRVIQAKSAILTDCLVLAEFANAAMRVRHELAISFSGASSNMKDYRASEFYEHDAWAVGQYLAEIRAQAQVVNVEPPEDWQALDASFQTGARDFNDEMIVIQCRRQNAILVTHDRDFVGAGIPVLTFNSAYFRC